MTDAEHIAGIEAAANDLADRLKAALEDDVSHALILPRLVLVFRESFGPMPAGMQIPGLAGLAQ